VSDHADAQRFRVTAVGADGRLRDGADPHWGRGDDLAAHRAVGDALPHAGFAVERRGAGGQHHEVTASLSVTAADALGAEALSRELVERVLPHMVVARVGAEPLTAAEVATYSATCESR
jgi:hypothetical protein